MNPVPGPHLTPDDLDAWLAGTLAPTAQDHLAVLPRVPGARGDRARHRRLARRPAVDEPGAGICRSGHGAGYRSQPIGVRSLRRRVFATRRTAALAASLLLLVAGSMAGSIVWTLGHQDTLAALGAWLTAQAGQAAWLGLRGVASNFIEQPWFAGLRSLAGSPGRLGLASALAMAAYVAGVLALRRLLALPTQQVAHVGVRRALAALTLVALLAPSAASAEQYD